MNRFARKTRLLTLHILACGLFLSACTGNADSALDQPLPQTIEAFKSLYLDDPDLEAKNVFRTKVGRINLTTGRLIVYDEYTAFTASNAFTLAADPGVYPVYQYWYLRGNISTAGTALTEVRFSSEQAVKWQRAIAKDNYFLPDTTDGLLMYDMHSRFGAFLSAEALDEIAVHTKSNSDPDAYLSRYKRDADQEATLNGIAFAIRAPSGDDVRTLLNLWGDRPFPSYFGIGADGKPVSLVTTYLYLEDYL